MGGGGSAQNMINAIKYNKAILRSRNHFKKMKNSGSYAPDRKLNRGKYSPQQVFETVTRIKYGQNKLLRKRVIVLVVTMVILISLLIVLNQRLLF